MLFAEVVAILGLTSSVEPTCVEETVGGLTCSQSYQSGISCAKLYKKFACCKLCDPCGLDGTLCTAPPRESEQLEHGMQPWVSPQCPCETIVVTGACSYNGSLASL